MIIGTNTAMFDGIELPKAFATLAAARFTSVELAYNEGYVGNLSADLFSTQHANEVKQWLQEYSLTSHALGCTMNLAKPDAVADFTQRITFAHELGATYLNACIGKRDDHALICQRLKELAPIATEHGCIICVENGGDPNFDIVSTATDAARLIEEINHDAVAINIDPGNMLSLIDEPPMEQAIAMLPYAKHIHIKDVVQDTDRFWFPAIGKGQLDYSPLLERAIALDIPCNLEIPLRMHRQPDATPIRRETPVALEKSKSVLMESRDYLSRIPGVRFS